MGDDQVPAGWYQDAHGQQRWWDGQRWALAPWNLESGVPSGAQDESLTKKRPSSRLLVALASIAVLVLGIGILTTVELMNQQRIPESGVAVVSALEVLDDERTALDVCSITLCIGWDPDRADVTPVAYILADTEKLVVVERRGSELNASTALSVGDEYVFSERDLERLQDRIERDNTPSIVKFAGTVIALLIVLLLASMVGSRSFRGL